MQTNPLIREIAGDIAESAENHVSIQVSSIDGEGHMLSTIWMLEGASFVDVADQITELFGKSEGSMTLDIAAAVPGIGLVMQDENTIISLTKEEGDNGA